MTTPYATWLKVSFPSGHTFRMFEQKQRPKSVHPWCFVMVAGSVLTSHHSNFASSTHLSYLFSRGRGYTWIIRNWLLPILFMLTMRLITFWQYTVFKDSLITVRFTSRKTEKPTQLHTPLRKKIGCLSGPAYSNQRIQPSVFDPCQLHFPWSNGTRCTWLFYQ